MAQKEYTKFGKSVLDKPRKLTDREIENVLDIFRNYPRAVTMDNFDFSKRFETVSDSVQRQFLEKCKRQLQSIQLSLPPVDSVEAKRLIRPFSINDVFNEKQCSCMRGSVIPSSVCSKCLPDSKEEDNLYKLKKRLIMMYGKSRVEPGTLVGSSAADSICAGVMQASMNTFHTSGSAQNIGNAISMINDIIFATSTRSLSYAIVFFENQHTFAELYAKRREFIAKRLDSLCTNMSVENPEMGGGEVGATYEDFDDEVDFHDNEEEYKGPLIRFKLKREDLFYFRLTPHKIVTRLLEEHEELSSKYDFVYGSIHDAYIDVRVKDFSSKEVDFKLLGELVLIKDMLNQTHISGIRGIVDAMVEKKTYLACFDGDKYIARRGAIYGITEEMVISAKRECSGDMTITDVNYKLSEKAQKLFSGKYTTYMRCIYNDKRVENDKSTVVKPEKKEKLTIIQTIISREDVNPNLCYCNNMHNMNDVFGINVAKTFTMHDLQTSLSSSGYINHTHIRLFCDYVFNKGQPYGARYGSMANQSSSALSLLVTERPAEALAKYAGTGTSEIFNTMSASIAMGTKVRAGTGYVTLIKNEDDIKRDEELQRIYRESQLLSIQDLGLGTIEKTEYAYNNKLLNEQSGFTVMGKPREQNIELTKLEKTTAAIPRMETVIEEKPKQIEIQPIKSLDKIVVANTRGKVEEDLLTDLVYASEIRNKYSFMYTW